MNLARQNNKIHKVVSFTSITAEVTFACGKSEYPLYIKDLMLSKDETKPTCPECKKSLSPEPATPLKTSAPKTYSQ